MNELIFDRHPVSVGCRCSFLPSKRFLFLAWQGATKCVFRVIDLRPNPNRSLFSKFFKPLKNFFHFGEKIFSTKRKFNLDRPKLECLAVSTVTLVCKYCTLAILDFPIAWCKIVRTHMVFAYNNPDNDLLRPNRFLTLVASPL